VTSEAGVSLASASDQSADGGKIWPLAQAAGSKPVTRCLEVRFRQGVDLHVPRSEVIRDAHG
jgi:hypothetical protein